MFKLILLIIKDIFSKKYVYIFLTAQLFIAIIALNFSIAIFNSVFYLKHLVNESGVIQGTYFYPNIKYSQSDGAEIKEKLSQLGGIGEYGSVNELYGKLNSDNTIIKTLVADKIVLNKSKLPLVKGNWFNTSLEESNYIPIIISYSLRNLFELNTKYVYRIFPDYGGSDSYYDITIKVIGILNKNNYAFDLSGSNLETMIKKNYDGIIMPFNENIMSGYSMKYNRGVFIFPQSNMSIQNIEAKINENLASYGESVLVKNLLKQYEDAKMQIMFLTASLGILVLIISTAGLGGNNMLSILANEKKYALYYMCGATWSKCIMMTIIKDLIILSIPLVLSCGFIEIISRFIPQELFTTNIIYLIMSISICLVIFLITSVGSILSIYKKSPVSIIRKWV